MFSRYVDFKKNMLNRSRTKLKNLGIIGHKIESLRIYWTFFKFQKLNERKIENNNQTQNLNI